MIYGTPKVMPFPVNLHKSLIKMPSPVRVTDSLIAPFYQSLLQTLVRTGSTKTTLFSDLHRCPVHEKSLPHHEETVENGRTALLPNG